MASPPSLTETLGSSASARIEARPPGRTGARHGAGDQIGQPATQVGPVGGEAGRVRPGLGLGEHGGLDLGDARAHQQLAVALTGVGDHAGVRTHRRGHLLRPADRRGRVLGAADHHDRGIALVVDLGGLLLRHQVGACPQAHQ